MHFILMLCMKAPELWGVLKWFVTEIKTGRSMREYRQSSRMQNECYSSHVYIETTTFYRLQGLRTEYGKLYEEEPKRFSKGSNFVSVNHQEVAQAYDGRFHNKTTSGKHAVPVATKLSSEAIYALVNLINREYPEVLLRRNSEFVKAAGDMIRKGNIFASLDCLRFRNFVSFSALRAVKYFLNAVTDGQKPVHVNTVYRLRHWSELRKSKSAQCTDLFVQSHLSMASVPEKTHFLSNIH